MRKNDLQFIAVLGGIAGAAVGALIGIVYLIVKVASIAWQG